MKKNSIIELSIVIPVFNEEKRIACLEKIVLYFRQQPYSFEVVVVDDGSTDDTLTLLGNYQNRFKELRIVRYAHNRGKGYAIKTGMLKSRGEFRLFTDIDLSTPLMEFEKFKPYLKKKDVIIGTRKDDPSSILIHQPFLREYLGKCFTRISQMMLGVYLTDFTCGFKCFSKKAALAIFSRSRIERWGFDAESMFIAQKLGLSIQEVSVVWQNDARTKVKLFSAAFKSFEELLTIRIADFKGYYR